MKENNDKQFSVWPFLSKIFSIYVHNLLAIKLYNENNVTYN